MKAIKSSLAGFILFTLVASGSFLTCEIGLGNSVDTKPPTVGISYPPTTSVIRGSFTVGGSVEDETNLKSVRVSLTDVETNAAAGEWSAEVNTAANTWTCDIPNEIDLSGQPAIADGEYEMTVVATDGAGRKTTVSGYTYALDNTAPIVLMTRPSTSGDDNPDPFGSELVFTGTLWDQNECASMTATFYKDAGDGTLTEIASHSASNMPQNWSLQVPADTFALLEAVMDDEESPQKFYYTLTASDNAYVYTDPEGFAVGITGNEADHVYLYDDLASLLAEGESFPSREILSDIESGREDSSGSFDAEILASLVIDSTTPSSDSSGSFSIDPNNKNPTVEISGLTWYQADEIDSAYTVNQIAGKSVVTVTVMPGPDDYSVKKDQIYAYLREKDDADRSLSSSDLVDTDDITTSGGYRIFNFDVEKTTGSWVLVIDAIDTAGYTTTRRDAKSTAYADMGYGEFAFTINGSAPYISALSPDTSKVRPSDGAFTLTITALDSDSSSLTLTVTDPDNGDAVVSSQAIAGSWSGSSSSYVFTRSLSLEAAADGESVSYDFSLNDGKYESSTVSRTFTTDLTSPELDELMSPILSSGTAAVDGLAILSENGLQVKASADATDLSLAQVCYTRSDEGASAPAASDSRWVSAQVSYDSDNDVKIFTGDLILKNASGTTAEGIYKIWYRLADDTEVFGATGYLCDVMVDKNSPSTTVALNDNFTWSGVKYSNASPIEISGEASDSLALDSVEISVSPAISGFPVEYTDIAATSLSWSTGEFTPDDDVYSFTIRVTDEAGQITTVTKQLAYDRTGPTLEVSNLEDGDFLTVSNYTIRGTALDDSGLASTNSVEYSVDGGTTWTAVDSPGQSWTQSVSGMTEGSANTIRFRATDSLGNMALQTSDITFGLDLYIPAVTITNDTTYASTYQNADFTLVGTSSDSSGIKALEYSLDDGVTWVDITTSIDASLPTSDSGTINWTQTVSVPSDHSEDGTKAIRVRATDAWDRVNTDAISVTFDTTAPTVTVSNLSDDTLLSSVTGLSALSFTATGTWTDFSGSGVSGGLAKMQYTVDGGTTWTDFSSVPGSNWSQVISLAQGLNKTIGFRAWDAVGNVSSASLFTGIAVDTALPTVTMVHDGSSDWSTAPYKTASFTLSGVAGDSQGVASVSVSASPSAGSGIGSVALSDAPGPGVISLGWSVPITPTADGSYAYTVTVTDVAGRTSSTVNTVVWDTTAPSLNVLNLDDGDAIITSTYKISGTASDTNGVAAIDYSLNGGDWTSVDTIGLSWSHTVSGLVEGPAQQIQFRATDTAGLETVGDLISFGLDLNNPALSVTDSATLDSSTQMADFVLAGYTDDASGIQALEISLDSGSTWTDISNTTPALETASATGGSGIAWSYSQTVDGTNDGLKGVRIRATDQYDKQTVVSLSIRFDATAPEIVVQNLVSAQSVSVTPYTVSGTWTDNGGSGTVAASGAYLEYCLNYTDDSNDLNDTWVAFDTTASSSWSQSVPWTEGLARSFAIRGSDCVGNVSEPIVLTGITVDTANPSASINVGSTTLGLADSGIYLRETDYTLSGDCDDDATTTGRRPSTATLTATKDGVSQGTVAYSNSGSSSFTTGGVTTGAWTYVQAVDESGHGQDGLWVYTLTVTDEAGKTATVTSTVRVDTTGPTFTVTAPLANEAVDDDTYGISGTSRDLGVGFDGTDDVEYKLSTSSTWIPLALSGIDWSDTTASLGTEGSKTINFRSTDMIGNESTIDRTFYFDLAAPTLTETTVGTTDTQYKNSNTSFTGVISDTNVTASPTLSVRINSGTAAAITPSGTSWSYTLDVDGADDTLGTADDLANGTYTLTFTASDAAARTTTVTRTVLVDKTAPGASVTTDLSAWKTGTIVIGGTCSDLPETSESVSGLNLVEYQLGGTGGTWIPASLSGTSWTGTLPLTGETEGNIGLYVRATDKAGNASSVASAAATVKIDHSAPTLTEETVGTTSAQYRTDDLVLGGTISDTNGSASPTMTVTIDSDSPVAITPSGTTWSYTYLAGTAVDGAHTLLFTATDAASKTTTVTRNVVVDNTAPVVSMNAVSGYHSGTVSISGTITETNLESVEYQLDSTAGTWTLASMSGTSWSGSIDFSAATEGAHTVYYRATDKAGNVSNSGTAQTTTVNVDRASPQASMTASATANGLTDTGLELREEAFTLSGTCDDAAITTGRLPSTVTLTATKDGSSKGTLTLSEGGAGTGAWEYDQAVDESGHTQDGLWVYTLTVTDVAGKTATATLTVRIDTTGPTIDITAPGSGESSTTSTYTITGTSRDTGGVGFVYGGTGTEYTDAEYSLNSSDGSDGDWEALNSLDGTINWSEADVDLGSTQGSQKLYVRSTDRLGNETLAYVDFYYDESVPTLTETTVNTTDTQYRNADLVFGGSASDTNAMASSSGLTVRVNGVGTTNITIDGSDNWSYSFDAASRANGTYNLVFTATDAANRTTTVTRTVVVDKSIPTVSITTINGGASGTFADWKGTSSLSIAGTASDSPTAANVTRVEYSMDGSNWYSLSGTTSWSGTVPAADGINTLRLRAVDLAGNVSSVVSQSVYVDLTNPSLSITTPSETKIVNGESDLAVECAVTDTDGSGAVSLKLHIGSAVFTTPSATGTLSTGTSTDGTWIASLDAATLAALTTGNQYTVYVQAADSVGNTSVSSFSLVVDKTDPTISISSPVATTTLNKTVDVTGIAGDTRSLASVTLEIYNPATPEWETLGTYSETAGYNWTLSDFDTETYGVSGYDTDSGTAGVQITLRATALDGAGNDATVSKIYTVDQNADRPVVKVSNIKIATETTLINSSIVSGTVTDDDGTIELEDFKVSEDGSSWIDASSDSDLDSGNQLYFDVDTRAFQYYSASGDGEKLLYFRVTDAEGATFSTPITYDAGDILTYPVIKDSLSATTAEAVAFKIDTNPPDIDSDIYFDNSSPYDFTDGETSDDSQKLSNNLVFGGTNDTLALYVRGRDATGVQGVSLTIGSYSYTLDYVSGTTGDWEIYTIDPDSPIDVSSWTDGNYTVTVTVKDNSNQTSASTRQIIIDNSAPSVEITSHTDNEQVTGDVILRGSAEDGTGSGLSTVSYKVGKTADTDPASTGWTSVTGTTSWYVSFTNAAGNVITTTGTYANSTYATETGSGTNVWILPVYVRGVDKTGNASVETFYFNVDPDGDKPTITVSYPDSGVTLGGTIRIFGSAEDNVKVGSVWMMIDTDGDDDFDSVDAAFLTAAGYSVTGSGTEEDPYEFQASGTASWSMSINASNEFDPSGDDTNYIGYRVRACDSSGTYGTWTTERYIYIDANAPRIGSSEILKLVQYDTDDTTIIAEQDYVADMYIRGLWYLIGSVEDESGITAISVSGDLAGTITTEPNWFIEDTAVGSYYNYTLRIPVGVDLSSSTTGNQSFDIYVEDGSDPTGSTTQAISINYDNKAPTMDAILHGGLEINDSDNLIVQSNNTFSFSSTAYESDTNDSGFDRLVFFFVRRGATSDLDRVYNPMLEVDDSQASGDVAGNRTYLENLTWDSGDVPLLSVTGATRGGEDSLTVSEVETNMNIRVGGLVRIAGVDRLIKSVERGTGTITFSPSVDTSYTDASFLYGQIVDNTVIETGVWSGSTLTSITNDDGDGMVESVTKSGGSYSWDAAIDSLNIPDGPIELHYIAYDESGNSNSGYVESAVQNNGPCIAKVFLGTDLDGDTEYSSSELTTYYTAASGSEPSAVNLASSAFVMKDKLAIIVEFVGGNGTLRYALGTNGAATDPWDGSTWRTAAITGSVTDFTSITLSDTSTTYSNCIEVASADVTAMDDLLKLFSVTVWDETDETTQGTNSQWALINAPMIVNVVDNVAPKGVISPFFWAGTDDGKNSLYGGSTSSGHIELEDALPSASFASGNTGVYDLDPKVSGQISIRGTAYDDVRLGKIWLSIGNDTDDSDTYVFYEDKSTTTPCASSTTFDMNADGDILDAGDTLVRTYYSLATFDKTTGVWIPSGATLADEGWQITITPDYLDQSGHKVDWQLDWDSSTMADVAAADRVIRVLVEDGRPNASSESENATANITTNNVPSYQVDVVPYITRIETSLSSLKTKNPSVFDRTALGHYPANAANSIYLHGFNLTGADVTGITGESDTGGVVTVPMSGASSGDLALTVNSVDLLNNVNDNDSEYNQQHNGDNNDLLTDDTVIDVWSFNNRAAVPISGRVEDPVMKISPYSGMIGFAFMNGPLYFSMPGTVGGTEYSYYYWQASYDFLSSIAMAYDSSGHTYGSAAGGDINASAADKFSFMTDRWGISGHASNGSYGGTNANRIESIGQYNSSGVIDFNKYRILSPSYVTTRLSSGANSTNIYLAYYDDINAEIRFRYGNLLDTATSKTNFNTCFTDTETTTAPTAYNSGLNNTAYVSMLAGSSTGRNPGEYLCLGVIPGSTVTTDVVVLVWYDATNRSLWYSYNDTPATNRANNKTAAGWSTPVQIFDEGGEYCQLTVDSSGGIHIAAYDSNNADLLYAYLSSYTDTTPETCVVDSYGIIGTNITIDVAKNSSGVAIPYIGYYSMSSVRPKYAYLVDTSSNAPDGAVDDAYTGAWEISLLPTASTVPQDRINVGVWKSAGVLTNSVSGTSSYYNNASGYTSTSYGQCYGNGTSNGVLAYQIKESTKGYIETAQKK